MVKMSDSDKLFCEVLYAVHEVITPTGWKCVIFSHQKFNYQYQMIMRHDHVGMDGYEQVDESMQGENLGGKVFVGGLSWQTTEEGLRYYFEKFGELTDVALMTDKRTGQPRGFGFITLKDPAGILFFSLVMWFSSFSFEAAEMVLNQEHTIDGRLVDVKRAVPRDRAPAPSK